MSRVSLTVAVTLAAVTAGCGSTAKPIATLMQFAGQANEICLRLSHEQAAIEAHSRPSGETAEAVWREVVAVSRVADVKVKALPRPPAQARTIERLVAGYFEEAGDEENIANAYASGDPAAVKIAYATWIALARRDARVARELGMIACAKAEPEQGAPSQSD
jgi:hypothetical protein